jgi:transposase-like protein
MSILSKKYFHDEAAAFAHVESILWPEGPICTGCGGVNNAYKLEGVRTKPSKKNPEGIVRHGLYKCKSKECRKQFTVRQGTLFEESHLALHKWLQAVYLLCSSKKGISTQQLKRTLEVDQKTAWFLGHRIRLGMESGDLRPFGQGGGAVEVDETFIGTEPGKKMRPGYGHKMKVLSLVDRETGRARSMVVDSIGAKEIIPILRENIAREARVMTDEGRQYQKLANDFPAHQSVNHGAEEYVREGGITTNTVEGFFSVFKRGMRGTYQHCRKQHLHRYLAEFDFRYTNRIAKGVDDNARAQIALEGFKGKRLTYKGSDSAVA